MIGAIRQNFTEASASVGLILATALNMLLRPVCGPVCITVILLQLVMVCLGTHLAKNHESQSRTIEFQFKKTMSPKLNFWGPLCNHADN